MCKGSRLYILALTWASLLTLCVTPSHLCATGLVELSGGPAQVMGGRLKSDGGWGSNLMLGYGGRPSWARKGTAYYAFASVSYDRLITVGPVELGEPRVRREQLSFGGGVRGYWLLKGSLRLWLGLGVHELFENASLVIEGLEPHELSDQSLTVTGSLGLQYKLRPNLCLSLGYHLTRFGSPAQVSLIERAALVTEEEGPWGRGRVALGLTYTF